MLDKKANLLFGALVNIQTPIPKLAESWRTDAFVGAQSVDTFELAVVLTSSTFILVFAGLPI